MPVTADTDMKHESVSVTGLNIIVEGVQPRSPECYRVRKLMRPFSRLRTRPLDRSPTRPHAN